MTVPPRVSCLVTNLAILLSVAMAAGTCTAARAAFAMVVSQAQSQHHPLLPSQLPLHRHLLLAHAKPEIQPKSMIATMRAARPAPQPVALSAAMAAIWSQ